MSNKTIKEFYDKYGDEIIKLRKSGMMVKDIAAKFNNFVGVPTLSSFLRRNGVLVRKQLMHDDKMEICERYLNGETPRFLSKEYHVTNSRICEIVREMGFTTRTRSSSKKIYSIDEHYFDKIDSQEKAYMIGLLLADGSRSSKGYTVSLSLQEADYDTLLKINNYLNNERPIAFVELSKKNPRHSNQYVLYMCGEHICKSLERFGITPRKDFTVCFPKDISEEFYPHVIRGLLDGDGFIGKTECRCGITGNKDLVTFLSDHISTTLNIHCSVLTPHKGKDTRDFRISGRKQVKTFLDYIYKDATLFINRKYLTYKTLYSNNNILSYAS